MILPKTTIKKGVIIKRFAILCEFFANSLRLFAV